MRFLPNVLAFDFPRVEQAVMCVHDAAIHSMLRFTHKTMLQFTQSQACDAVPAAAASSPSLAAAAVNRCIELRMTFDGLR